MGWPESDRSARAGDGVAALLRRGAAAAACAVAVVLLVPAAPAHAHPAGVQAAVDYRTRVTAIEPALAGVRARYVPDGSRLELRNDSGRTIEILGYQGEPMLQVRPDGVWRNTRAPSLYVDQSGVPVNPAADARADPQWQRISDRPVARWQDHRAWWHGSPPPYVRVDQDRVQRVVDWRVPLRDGTTTAQITGTLDWVPPPDPNRWWAAALLIAAAIGALGLVAAAADGTARGRALRTGIAACAFATGAAAAGYPLLIVADNAEPHPGGITVALLSEALPILLGAVVIAAGVAVRLRRPIGDFGLAFGGVAAAVLAGGTNAALFTHAVAPISLDGWWARLAEVVVLGGGVGLAAAGMIRMRREALSFGQRARDGVTGPAPAADDAPPIRDP